MINIFKFAPQKNTLLAKLLTSFLIVIALLTCFHLIAFTFFNTSIRDEIRNYNSLNLDNTVQSYEEHLAIVSNAVRALFFDDTIHMLTEQMRVGGRSNAFYYDADKAVRHIQTLLANNPHWHVDNVLLFYNNESTIVDKNGVHSADDFFGYFYRSESYPLKFWEGELQESKWMKILPESVFFEMRFNQEHMRAAYIPLLIKNHFERDMIIIALLDSDRMLQAFHDSINQHLLIRDADGRNIYTTDRTMAQSELSPAANTDVQSSKVGSFYYFYKQGAYTGFTYVNAVPYDHISSKIVHLNMILLLFLFITLAIGLAASIFFSVRFTQPVQQVLKDIRQVNTSDSVRSNIKEFDMIRDQVRSMLQTSEAISKDLAAKTIIMKKFAIIEHLKQTYNNIHGIRVWNGIEQPYRFVLFQLDFKRTTDYDTNGTEDRATCFIRELINRLVAERYPGSLTVQLEHHQIVSVLFTEREETVPEAAEEWKRLFDQDRDYYYLTICVSASFEGVAHFSKAYEQTLDMMKLRRLNDETQIIVTPMSPPAPVRLSPIEENELIFSMMQGNAAEAHKLVQRKLMQLVRSELPAFTFVQVGHDMVRLLNKALAHHRLEAEPSERTLEQLQSLHSAEQFSDFFRAYVQVAAERIVRKTEQKDRIVDFVTQFVEGHYAADISLAGIAEKLRVTDRYLSNYFKDKTGTNFIDYLHEVRIRKAKELLLDTNEKIQDIAEKIGYRNLNSFIRLFKKHVGQTPGQFRKQAGLDDSLHDV